jgi:hypothetical protein
MAFYFVFDGVVDTAVSFEDGSEFATFTQFMRASAANELGNIDGNRANIAAGVASVDIAPDRGGGYEGQTYDTRYFQSPDVEATWFALEDGAIDGIATGTTVTEVYSVVTGTATGEVNGTATGVTVSEVYSLIPGAASGGIPATAPGATVSEIYSVIAGSATGEVNATASGVVLTEVYSAIPGSASGSSATDATASGATTAIIYSLQTGQAIGDAPPIQQFIGDGLPRTSKPGHDRANDDKQKSEHELKAIVRRAYHTVTSTDDTEQQKPATNTQIRKIQTTIKAFPDARDIRASLNQIKAFVREIETEFSALQIFNEDELMMVLLAA